ncbi:hypothetical protein Q5P01_014704 [Channa striata]|uniref:Secreted protein n=1 Tax=Channa striata TaxID=64152 RepID=A0AA88MKC9_CHASR|nr:hypothetical protein Q5P01_014704 [Channa striata]
MEGQAIPGYLARASAFSPTFLLLCVVRTGAHIGPHCARGSITPSPSAVLPPQTDGAIPAAQKEKFHIQVPPLRDDFYCLRVSETRASEELTTAF